MSAEYTVEFAGRRIRPGKIVCVGRNYADHARELGNAVPDEPVFFMKPASSIAERLALPAAPVRFEAELTYLWSGGSLAGLALGLDLTLGELQKELKDRGLPWERAKAFRGSALFSPFVAVADVGAPGLELRVNGELRQQGNLSGMIFAPERLATSIAAQFGLEDGDLIMTGTPAGVGPLTAGDRVVGRLLDGERTVLEANWTVQSP